MQSLFKNNETPKMPKYLPGLIFLMIIPILSKANSDISAFRYTITASLLQDTSGIKKSDVVNNKQEEEIIKVVPKARKQAVPIPVKLQVKPVKVVKPKIIKPVIRILK